MIILRRILFWVAIAWCALTTIVAVERLRFAHEAVEVLGVVEQIDGRGVDCTRGRQCQRTAFTATVRYNADGDTYRIAMSAGSAQVPPHVASDSGADVRVGDSIPLQYHPKRPSRATPRTLLGRWGMPLLAIASGLFAFALARSKEDSERSDEAAEKDEGYEDANAISDEAAVPRSNAALARPSTRVASNPDFAAFEAEMPAVSPESVDVASRYGTRETFEETVAAARLSSEARQASPSSAASHEKRATPQVYVYNGPPVIIRLIGVGMAIAGVVVGSRNVLEVLADDHEYSGIAGLIVVIGTGMRFLIPCLIAFLAYRALVVAAAVVERLMANRAAKRATGRS